MQSPSSPSGDGDAGPRGCEPLPGSSEERAAGMFDRIAEYIEEVRTSLRINVSDHVYARYMAELRSLREGRFDRVTQSLENLRALIDKLHSRLVLVEDSCFASPGPSGQGRPERPTPARRPEDRTSPSAEQLGAFAFLSDELDATRRRAHDIERTMAERLPGAPREGPVVPYLRVQPRHKDGARLGSSPVAAQRRDDLGWTPKWRPKPKLCRPPPEAGSRPDWCLIGTTLTVEEPPADPDNPCSPLIPAVAATRRQTTPSIQVRQTSGRYPPPPSERWVPPNPGSSRCIR